MDRVTGFENEEKEEKLAENVKVGRHSFNRFSYLPQIALARFLVALVQNIWNFYTIILPCTAIKESGKICKSPKQFDFPTRQQRYYESYSTTGFWNLIPSDFYCDVDLELLPCIHACCVRRSVARGAGYVRYRARYNFSLTSQSAVKTINLTDWTSCSKEPGKEEGK